MVSDQGFQCKRLSKRLRRKKAVLNNKKEACFKQSGQM
jgi:hypothetical protein